MPIGSRYFLVKRSKLGKYSQNEIFLFWEWSILFVVSAHMGDLISERLLRPVCSFPNSSLAFLSETIFQHFWGFSRNFQRGLGGLQGLVCSQIIKEHNLARGQNLEERWQNGTTTKWYFFTFRVFPFLALHCQLVVHCSEVDRREEKG